MVYTLVQANLPTNQLPMLTSQSSRKPTKIYNYADTTSNLQLQNAPLYRAFVFWPTLVSYLVYGVDYIHHVLSATT